ncbi:restriction endonuclease subunit S [Pseudomonas aeruginosa]|uniref:restriction endonuclease subunit S n=1 Tax=Pseudomonadaceae TaxID=135621 RepID=UPI000EDDE224|nr:MULTISPECIES: restriction endonuclease subunit S [Pseudomonadaceae]HAJ88148.1 restriction endonuclease subunit S [Pseudomonas sp.]EKX3430913.1 restriction endonuclease subunit S [Pseudomonas aeruginosa]MDH1539573.1 restriction endonuclease subunit S [Stutzerimonas stutzeri]HCF3661467.1 restriction endonuclease subunit S [Pseudomonas aeruginosa]HCF3692748.1 restriction endonuclease subunit S [Pseudomonas aeruginosa]
MTFPAYPAYKDSGVEWLGEVPEHWAVHPLKRAIERIESGTSVNAADFPAEPGSLGVLKTSCVYTGKFDWAENKSVDDEDLSRVSCPLRKDTLIVSRMNTPDLVGATGLVTEAPNGIFLPDRLWQVYFLVNHSPEFLFYFSKSREYREQVKMACSGTSASMQNLGQDDFRGLLFAEPPKPEQTQIARFLDHETARIDALIEEQQRLIELLKEKRQAVISHAVTKGLDPTVPMKDSGVEWLGEVPAHWQVGALKHFISPVPGAIKTGPFGSHLKSEDMKEGPYKVFNQRSVIDADFSAGDNFISEEKFAELRGFTAFPGDVLVTTRGTIGRAAILPDNAEVGILHPCLLRVQVDESKITSSYLCRLIQESHLLKTQLSLMSNSTTIEVIYSETMANLLIPVPPITEQAQIAAFLDDVISKFGALTSDANESVRLLQERRSALISAAVTGKIDVRGWQPPASTQAPKLEEVAEAV